MAKWYGKIGYYMPTKIEAGMYDDSEPVERSYYGDLITDRRKRQNSGEINDNIDIGNSISIIADPFANQNCSYMAYAEFMGAKWKITNVEVQFPRLILSLGGVYNG